VLNRKVCGRSSKSESERKLNGLVKKSRKKRSEQMRFDERVKLRVVVTNLRQIQMTHEGWVRVSPSMLSSPRLEKQQRIVSWQWLRTPPNYDFDTNLVVRWNGLIEKKLFRFIKSWSLVAIRQRSITWVGSILQRGVTLLRLLLGLGEAYTLEIPTQW